MRMYGSTTLVNWEMTLKLTSAFVILLQLLRERYFGEGHASTWDCWEVTLAPTAWLLYSHTAATDVIIDVYKNIDGQVWLAEKVAPRSDD